MMFFIHHVQTYSNVNNKGREMCDFANSFDHLLVIDECSLDSLKCSFEAKVNELNEKYPKTKPIAFSCGHLDGTCGQFSVKVENDEYRPVCFISYSAVRGFYSFGEGVHQHALAVPGKCSECGCTDDDPCYNPDYGTCSWANEEHTLCSHCADTIIANDPATEHCINTKGGHK